MNFFITRLGVICFIKFAVSLDCYYYDDIISSVAKDGTTERCINAGFNCTYFGCEVNRCVDETEDEDSPGRWPESVYTSEQHCSSPTALCRILYYEIIKIDEEAAEKVINIEFQKSFLKKECYENLDGDEEVGCNFYHKPLYLTRGKRLTFIRECYCDQNYCNKNISYACSNVEGTDESDMIPCSSVTIYGEGIFIFTLLVIALRHHID